MAGITITLNVFCTCGRSLDVEWNERRGEVEVQPCETCLEKERDESYASGYKDGKLDRED